MDAVAELRGVFAALFEDVRAASDEIDALDVFTLSTPAVASVAERMRVVFERRTRNHARDVAVLCVALDACPGAEDVLLRHELAYCLGQMRRVEAIDVLSRRLRDVNDDVVVRHEAAEALGAIGCVSALPVLREFTDDISVEVAQTARLSVRNLENSLSVVGAFGTVDPIGATTAVPLRDPLELQYHDIFKARDARDVSALSALLRVSARNDDALFRHEVCYVLGQLEDEGAIDALSDALRNPDEHAMVRHEAAEALGAIGTPACMDLLSAFSRDPEEIVAQSCVVALDTRKYWESFGSQA